MNRAITRCGRCTPSSCGIGTCMVQPRERRWRNGVGVPVVTVVIPAFNAEPHIAEALASICDQTLRDVEVLIVDDGSTDGTVREAERFTGKLDLTIVRQ